MSETIRTAVPMIQKGLKQMEKIGIDKAAYEFEQVFESLDVKSGAMNAALDSVHSSSISQNAVEDFMKQIQEEAALEIGGESHVRGQKLPA